MNKAQALHEFWSGFGLTAYDENSVPTGSDKPNYPYITYEVATDSFGNVVGLYGSIWYRSTSWVDVNNKADEIAKAIGENGYHISKVDGGYLLIRKGTPFAQRMTDDEDDMVRRIYINIMVEYLTAY